MKRIIPIILLCSVLLCGCVSQWTTLNDMEKREASTVLKADKFLVEKVTDIVNKENYTRYLVKDINYDGTPEIYLEGNDDNKSYSCLIMTYEGVYYTMYNITGYGFTSDGNPVILSEDEHKYNDYNNTRYVYCYSEEENTFTLLHEINLHVASDKYESIDGLFYILFQAEDNFSDDFKSLEKSILKYGR